MAQRAQTRIKGLAHNTVTTETMKPPAALFKAVTDLHTCKWREEQGGRSHHAIWLSMISISLPNLHNCSNISASHWKMRQTGSKFDLEICLSMAQVKETKNVPRGVVS